MPCKCGAITYSLVEPSIRCGAFPKLLTHGRELKLESISRQLHVPRPLRRLGVLQLQLLQLKLHGRPQGREPLHVKLALIRDIAAKAPSNSFDLGLALRGNGVWYLGDLPQCVT